MQDIIFRTVACKMNIKHTVCMFNNGEDMRLALPKQTFVDSSMPPDRDVYTELIQAFEQEKFKWDDVAGYMRSEEGLSVIVFKDGHHLVGAPLVRR